MINVVILCLHQKRSSPGLNWETECKNAVDLSAARNVRRDAE